jgi:hypothetical protein
MITQIVVHLLPHEIDWFEWQSKQFKIGSSYVSTDIIIDVTLNLNLVDWNKSTMPKQFYIDKFNYIETLWDWAETRFDINEDGTCLGCDDKRRTSIRSSVSDNILYLDSDLIFKPETLSYILSAASAVEDSYYIISPQTVRMWDSSWDVITNRDYMNTPANMETYYANDPFAIITKEISDISLKKINEFKFGGGWFNLLSTNLLKLTDIPDSFGPYGIDDLYVMQCCSILKQKGIEVNQYIVDGLVVVENFKYRRNYHKDFLYLIDNQKEYRAQAEDNLGKELHNFSKKVI